MAPFLCSKSIYDKDLSTLPITFDILIVCSPYPNYITYLCIYPYINAPSGNILLYEMGQEGYDDMGFLWEPQIFAFKQEDGNHCKGHPLNHHAHTNKIKTMLFLQSRDFLFYFYRHKPIHFQAYKLSYQRKPTSRRQ